jgi:hypothetical protein
MIDTHHPEFLAIVAAIRSGKPVDPVWTDWLEDDGPKPWVAETKDFVEVFCVPPARTVDCILCAGTGSVPSPRIGGSLPCRHCNGRGKQEHILWSRQEDASLKPILVAWLRRMGDERAEAVEQCAWWDRREVVMLFQSEIPQEQFGEGDVFPGGSRLLFTRHPTEAAAVLAMKRRVARMFGEFRYARKEMSDLEELTAEQLLPPEAGRDITTVQWEQTGGRQL